MSTITDKQYIDAIEFWQELNIAGQYSIEKEASTPREVARTGVRSLVAKGGGSVTSIPTLKGVDAAIKDSVASAIPAPAKLSAARKQKIAGILDFLTPAGVSAITSNAKRGVGSFASGAKSYVDATSPRSLREWIAAKIGGGAGTLRNRNFFGGPNSLIGFARGAKVRLPVITRRARLLRSIESGPKSRRLGVLGMMHADDALGLSARLRQLKGIRQHPEGLLAGIADSGLVGQTNKGELMARGGLAVKDILASRAATRNKLSFKDIATPTNVATGGLLGVAGVMAYKNKKLRDAKSKEASLKSQIVFHLNLAKNDAKKYIAGQYSIGSARLPGTLDVASKTFASMNPLEKLIVVLAPISAIPSRSKPHDQGK